MEKKYGGLFANDKQGNQRAPDLDGYLEIGPGLLDYMNALRNSGQPIKVDLAGWNKPLKQKHGTWISLSASEPFDSEVKAPHVSVAEEEDDEEDIPY